MHVVRDTVNGTGLEGRSRIQETGRRFGRRLNRSWENMASKSFALQLPAPYCLRAMLVMSNMQPRSPRMIVSNLTLNDRGVLSRIKMSQMACRNEWWPLVDSSDV
jgi:hypothetical protein